MFLDLQPTSHEIWSLKHRLSDYHGNYIDETVYDNFKRVAKNLAKFEHDPDEWTKKFYQIMQNGCIPAGRILANAGAQQYKNGTTLINCVVASNIKDSLESILNTVHEFGTTLKTGAGIGGCFSTIRPSGSFVKGVNAHTSGPLSFADIFDKTCFTISSAGGRRGSMMLTFHVWHPDIFKVIEAKKEDGRLRQFNISILITDEFIEAVKNNDTWELYFPIHKDDPANKDIIELKYKEYPIKDDDTYIYNSKRHALCKIYKTVNARDLWTSIMKSNYDYAEPGFILIDKINRENNLYFCENIISCNPCGEQPLNEYASCLLSSINLTQYVKNPFTDDAHIDFNQLEQDLYVLNRMMDNVVEHANLPLDVQTKELVRKRRHGLGIFGLGSTFSLMKLKYGSEKSIELTHEITKLIAISSIKAGVELAKEKGPAPIMEEEFEITKELLEKNKNLPYELGDIVKGKELIIYSDYMRRINEVHPELILDVKRYGMRYSHATSIAPTGTLALGVGNNASNGIEPTFSHEYIRNVIKSGKKTKETMTVYSYEALLYKKMFGENAELPEWFSTADNISPLDHINIQAAAQPWVDSSISKTINCPTDIKFKDFENIYMQAYEKGLKSATTFRFNPERFQGVLVTEDNLKNTKYNITFEDGSETTLSGDTIINYQEDETTVANLYDALKEGYYGKF